jgi:hypothetical protein
MKKFYTILLALTLIWSISNHPALINKAFTQEIRLLPRILGGGGGNQFSDLEGLQHIPVGSTVYEVRIRAGAFVDSIQIIHRSGRNLIHPLSRHGGSGGNSYTFRLNSNIEYIEKIIVRYGRFVDSIQIKTNLRFSPRYGGGGGGKPVPLEDPGTEIIGFHGRSGSLIDAIGIIVRDR